MQTNIIWLIIGIAAGIIIGFIVTAVSPLGNRYYLSASSDGATVHRVDTWSGRVWIKNALTESGPEGNPVTVSYWEELLPDKPVAAAAAKGQRVSVIEERQAQQQQQRQLELEELEIKQRRLIDIASLCGDDMVCVHDKCSTGYKGSADPEWTTYCTEMMYTNIVNLVIDQCAGNEWCIKRHCKQKHNNTYPAVSDCVRDINLVKIKNENEGSLTQPE